MRPRVGVRLVMAPGVGADARLFAPQLAVFADAEVIQWLTPETREPLSRYARRLAESVQNEGSDPAAPVVLVGVSLGGMLALEMSRHLDARGVVLVASCRSPREVNRLGWAMERVGRLLPDRGVAALSSCRAGVGAAFGPAGREEVSVLMRMLADAPMPLVRWAGRAILEWEGCEAPGVPVRHIHGVRDRIVVCRRVCADEVVPGAGHLVNMTHPERVNAFIRAAVDGFVGAGR